MNQIMNNSAMNQLNLDGCIDGFPLTTFDDDTFGNIFDSDISVVSISPMGSPLPIVESRRVSFAPTVRVYPTPLHFVDRNWWYSRDELMQFRDTARRMASYFWSFKESRQENRPMMALGAETRGLEGKFCHERQKRKYWSKRYIVGASQQKWFAERIADAATQLNTWAIDLALEEGKRDYERAYEKENDVEDYFGSCKRCSPETEEKERSVRQKLG